MTGWWSSKSTGVSGGSRLGRSVRVLVATAVLVGATGTVAVGPGMAGFRGTRAVQEGGSTDFVIDLRCVGSGIHRAPGEPNDRDAKEVLNDDDLLPDCIDPLIDPDNRFTATVRNKNGVAQKDVRVGFMFGQRINGNAAGANNSTDDATLKADGGSVIGTNPGSLKTVCRTGSKGRCSATLTNMTPQGGDTIVVIASIAGQLSARSSDSATEQWQTGVVHTWGRLTLKPATDTQHVGTQQTLTAKLTNQFGQPVQGGNIDFQITAGPNVGLTQAGMTDAVTNAEGLATLSYMGNQTGRDTIQACSETGGTENDTCNGGEPNDVAFTTWTTG